MGQQPTRLTESEGTLLALVERAEPITAHQIARVYEDSPVSNFNTSKGTIYPIVRRLRAGGLLRAQKVKGDRRGTELLAVTNKGRKAIRAWLLEIRPAHLLPEDALRTKVQSFNLLTKQERIEWISDLKLRLLEKLDEVDSYREQVDVPFHELVHKNAIQSIRSRMDWLDLLLANVVRDEE